MKTLELKLKKDVLIVEAPLDAYDVSIGTHCIGVRTNENVEKDTNGFYHIYKKGLFFGDIDMKLEFLCKGSELTEEIASELVEMEYSGLYKKSFYIDYDRPSLLLKFAKESFVSAVESKGFHWLKHNIKPFSLYDPRSKTGCHDLEEEENVTKQWQEAEEKTFKNPLIFVKK